LLNSDFSCIAAITIRLDPKSMEDERWIPDYVGFHLEPVHVVAKDVQELERVAIRGKGGAEEGGGGGGGEGGVLPLCGGATPGLWWGAPVALHRAGADSGSACYHDGGPERHPDQTGTGEKRMKLSGLFDETAPRGPLLSGAGGDAAITAATVAVVGAVAAATATYLPGGGDGALGTAAVQGKESAAGTQPEAGALRWRPTEPCRECRVRRRDTALECLRRHPMVMLGDSVMLQQCEQLKIALVRRLATGRTLSTSAVRKRDRIPADFPVMHLLFLGPPSTHAA